MVSLPQLLLSPFPLLLKPQISIRPSSRFPPPSLNSHKTHFRFSTRATLLPKNQNSKPHHEQNQFPPNLEKNLIPLAAIDLLTSLPCSASEAIVPNEQVSDRINLESILVAIDDFFTRYPFFVAGCTFIWLVAIPLAEEYLRKYKYVNAIDVFNRLKSDPDAQLLDIRDKKNLDSLRSPSLRVFNKSVVQVEYTKEDEDGFVKNVLEKFPNRESISICILDNSGDDSYKVAELLSKEGFKVAYAIKGGVKGKKGWLAIQETLLPPTVHISGKNKKASVPQKETELTQ